MNSGIQPYALQIVELPAICQQWRQGGFDRQNGMPQLLEYGIHIFPGPQLRGSRSSTGNNEPVYTELFLPVLGL